jgi:hypothetical protein
MCRDQSLSYLNAVGYNVVSFAGPRKNLGYMGDLSDLVVPGPPLPEIERDDPAGDVVGRRTNRFEASVGLNLLEKLLSAFGGNEAKISAGYNHAASIQIIFLNVMHDFVAPLRVGNYLRNTRIQPESLETLSQYEHLYLVTDTLKSNQFGVVAYDQKEDAIEINADAIQNILGAQASVKVASQADHVIRYSGSKRLRFGFRALDVLYDEQHSTVRLNVHEDLLVARAKVDKQQEPALPPEAFELFTPDELLEIDFI